MLARMCPCMHAYNRADTNVCLSVCLSVCLYACKYVYMCVCQNEGLIKTLRMLSNMSDYIGTGILEVCECPESVADWSNGFGWVLGGKIELDLIGT